MSIEDMDDMVLEYLMYRGFLGTFKSMQREMLQDPTSKMDADQVVHNLIEAIQNSELSDFLKLWGFLEARFFSQLDSEYVPVYQSFLNALMKYYLVVCIQRKRRERAIEALNKFSQVAPQSLSLLESAKLDADDQVYASDGWRTWFSLPHLKEPEKDPLFAPYFNSAWKDQLYVNLHNFISSVLRAASSSAPSASSLGGAPRLMLLENWHRKARQAEIREELKVVREELVALKGSRRRAEERLRRVRGGLVTSSFANIYQHHQQQQEQKEEEEEEEKERAESEEEREQRRKERNRKSTRTREINVQDVTRQLKRSADVCSETFHHPVPSLLEERVSSFTSSLLTPDEDREQPVEASSIQEEFRFAKIEEDLVKRVNQFIDTIIT